MEKRVIVFLIVSLAVIIGYDYLLKGMGLLPPSEPVQVATNPSPAAETGKPGGGGGRFGEVCECCSGLFREWCARFSRQCDRGGK